MKKIICPLLFVFFISFYGFSQSPIKLDTTNATVQVNWVQLKQLLTSCNNLSALAGKDSVDYIGQVYYSTAYKTEGFNRTAIKRSKANGSWYYESYIRTSTDSNKVRNIFFALYDELKKAFKDNCDGDFILASVAEKSISASPVTWLAQWTLYNNYKILPEGLGKLKIAIMLSGSKDVFRNNIMDYTIKIYITNQDVKYDIFGWDKPI